MHEGRRKSCDLRYIGPCGVAELATVPRDSLTCWGRRKSCDIRYVEYGADEGHTDCMECRVAAFRCMFVGR